MNITENPVVTSTLDSIIGENKIIPVFLVASGAHLYGFPSSDSDVDVRGVFAYSTERMLGMDIPSESINQMTTTDPVVDVSIKEIRAFLRAIRRNNGAYFEKVHSPHVIITSPEHDELKTLTDSCISKELVPFYEGFASRLLKEATATKEVKLFLYAARNYLAGTHLMRTGEIISDINVLNQDPRYPVVDDLVDQKTSKSEKGEYDGDIDKVVGTIGTLKENFMRSCEKSPLTEKVPQRAIERLDNYLINFRGKH